MPIVNDPILLQQAFNKWQVGSDKPNYMVVLDYSTIPNSEIISIQFSKSRDLLSSTATIVVSNVLNPKLQGTWYNKLKKDAVIKISVGYGTTTVQKYHGYIEELRKNTKDNTWEFRCVGTLRKAINNQLTSDFNLEDYENTTDAIDDLMLNAGFNQTDITHTEDMLKLKVEYDLDLLRITQGIWLPDRKQVFIHSVKSWGDYWSGGWSNRTYILDENLNKVWSNTSVNGSQDKGGTMGVGGTICVYNGVDTIYFVHSQGVNIAGTVDYGKRDTLHSFNLDTKEFKSLGNTGMSGNIQLAVFCEGKIYGTSVYSYSYPTTYQLYIKDIATGTVEVKNAPTNMDTITKLFVYNNEVYCFGQVKIIENGQQTFKVVIGKYDKSTGKWSTDNLDPAKYKFGIWWFQKAESTVLPSQIPNYTHNIYEDKLYMPIPAGIINSISIIDLKNDRYAPIQVQIDNKGYMNAVVIINHEKQIIYVIGGSKGGDNVNKKASIYDFNSNLKTLDEPQTTQDPIPQANIEQENNNISQAEIAQQIAEADQKALIDGGDGTVKVVNMVAKTTPDFIYKREDFVECGYTAFSTNEAYDRIKIFCNKRGSTLDSVVVQLEGKEGNEDVRLLTLYKPFLNKSLAEKYGKSLLCGFNSEITITVPINPALEIGDTIRCEVEPAVFEDFIVEEYEGLISKGDGAVMPIRAKGVGVWNAETIFK